MSGLCGETCESTFSVKELIAWAPPFLSDRQISLDTLEDLDGYADGRSPRLTPIVNALQFPANRNGGSADS
jgi:hypothetical protein